MPGVRLSPHQVSWAGKPSNHVGIRRRGPREHVLRPARPLRKWTHDTDDDTRRLAALRVDPHRYEAYRAVNELSCAAEQRRSPVFYTYNKLLWLIGWAWLACSCSAITDGDLSKLGRLDAGVDQADDAGELERDAGELEHDAGKVVDPDRPVEQLDAGELEHDAGEQLDDAGLDHDDAGELERDASMPPPPCDAPSFSTGANYDAGDDVQAGGRLYRCKPAPASSWCGLDGYEPGSGPYWRDAWLELGPCTSELHIPGFAKPWTL